MQVEVEAVGVAALDLPGCRPLAPERPAARQGQPGADEAVEEPEHRHPAHQVQAPVPRQGQVVVELQDPGNQVRRLEAAGRPEALADFLAADRVEVEHVVLDLGAGLARHGGEQRRMPARLGILHVPHQLSRIA